MSSHTRSTRRRVTTVLTVGALLLVGCGGDDGEPSPDAAAFQIEDLSDRVLEHRRGVRCVDEVGDLTADVRAEENLSEPAGVDLVLGEVEFLGEGEQPSDLWVRFELAGDVREVEEPVYLLFQGFPGQLTSWELQVQRDEDDWVLELVTYETDEGRVMARSTPERLDIEVALDPDGQGLEYQVPLQLLPPVVSVWVFGTSGVYDGQTVIDDCETLEDRVVGGAEGSDTDG
ncbi:MAG: hypothetical protein JJU45_06780 [Acidimicrobiia bacterium]|nr:hypothetical protein [Acidimicrobiia bacterium]